MPASLGSPLVGLVPLLTSAAALDRASMCLAPAPDNMLLQVSSAHLRHPEAPIDARARADGRARGARRPDRTRRAGPEGRGVPGRGALVGEGTSDDRSQWDTLQPMANTEEMMTKLEETDKSVKDTISKATAEENSLVKWQHVGEAVITLTTTCEILTEADYQVEAQMSNVNRTIEKTKALKTLFKGGENEMSEFEAIAADSEKVRRALKDVDNAAKDIDKIVGQTSKLTGNTKDVKDLISGSPALAGSVAEVDMGGLDALTTKMGELEPKIKEDTKKLSDIMSKLDPLLAAHDGSKPLSDSDIPTLVEESKSLGEVWSALRGKFATEVQPVVQKATGIVEIVNAAIHKFEPKMTDEKPASPAPAPPLPESSIWDAVADSASSVFR